nr:hypothetical protein [Mycobacterium kyogaense]
MDESTVSSKDVTRLKAARVLVGMYELSVEKHTSACARSEFVVILFGNELIVGCCGPGRKFQVTGSVEDSLEALLELDGVSVVDSVPEPVVQEMLMPVKVCFECDPFA